MSDPSQTDREVMDLLSAAWDDRLDEASREKLEQLVSENDFAKVPLLVEFSRMHLDLEWIVSSRSAQRKAMAAVARANAKLDRSRSRRSIRRLAVGLAAALFLAMAGWGVKAVIDGARRGDTAGEVAGVPMERPPLPVGRVTFGEGVQLGVAGQSLQDGQTLLEGDLVDILAGSVRVSMDAGAEMSLGAPCRLRVVDRVAVALETGRVEVRVASWVREFTVRTDDLTVTDLGTRFVVDADGAASTEVHVIEGLVVASPAKQPDVSRRLGAHTAARATDEGTLENVAFRGAAFGRQLDAFRPLRPLPIANTGVNGQVGEEDAKWRITAGTNEFGPYPLAATVNATDARHGLNEVGRSQWISVKEGITRSAPVRSKYTYETTFDLSGYDPRSVRLTGLILADSGVAEIRLNGQLLPIAPWVDWYPGVTFIEFHSIEINSGFAPGKNVLSIVVTNEVELPPADQDVELPPTPNAMGLRVEWQGAGRPL